jgi:hypothetical protein
MKKNTVTALILMSLFLLPIQTQLFAQAPDTVDVPFMIDNNPLGAINKFILGDTTATGERNNINRVYKCGRGMIYFFDSIMETHFPLTLIAEDDDPANPTAPPVLAPGILEDNTSPTGLIDAYDNAIFKNLYFCAIRPDQVALNYNIAVRLYLENGRYVVNNCVFDGWGSGAIRQYGNFARVFITDCHVRNELHPSSWFGGNLFISGAIPTDTVVIVNNTFFNCGSYLFCPNREVLNYGLVEHNTVFTNHVNLFYAPYVHNTFYKNNILYGLCAMGQRPTEISGGWFDWKGEISGVVSLDTIPTDIKTREGFTEADRTVHVVNNAYFWPQKMIDFWANSPYDSAGVTPVLPDEQKLTPPLWINDRTQAMLDDDAAYPNLVVENNLNVDPQFTDPTVMAMVDSLMKYCLKIRNFTQTDYRHYYYANGSDPLFPPAWPLPENLTYSNAALLTAGTDGFPLGDLNWYPDKKQEWLTSVEFDEPGMTPAEFELSQNYPNPFNPTTMIKFNLKKSMHIKLTVYNMLGQKVKTLVDQKMLAGSHITTWNGQDDNGKILASGIYYYRLETESFKTTKKMVLMK